MRNTTYRIRLSILCSFIAIFPLNAEHIQIKKGNFLLPPSQQVGPLFGFGQNILDKGETQAFLYADSLQGNQKSFTEVIPSFLYAFNNDSSIFISMPFATEFKLGTAKSSGIEDISIQFEQVVYLQEKATVDNQATVVAAVTFPTGSTQKKPVTGLGAPSVFLGFTLSQTLVDWYFFTSNGIIVPAEHNGLKFGKIAIYQGGLSRTIWCPKGWIIAGMLEFFGTFIERPVDMGVTNPNEGGHVFFIGPSIWVSSSQLIAQGGIGIVAAQHLFGTQFNNDYVLAMNIGWKF